MILAFHGKAVRLDELRASLGSGREGTTALSLLNVARAPWAAGPRRESGDRGSPVPAAGDCILHWDFSHFVVLERVGGRGIHIVDPALGRRSVTMSEVRRSFTGVVLLLEPGETFEPMTASRKSAWRYLQEVLRESGLWIRISVISVLLQLFGLGAATTHRRARGSGRPKKRLRPADGARRRPGRVHRVPFPGLVDSRASAAAGAHAGGRADDTRIHRAPRGPAVRLLSTALGRRPDDAAQQQRQRARDHHRWRAVRIARRRVCHAVSADPVRHQRSNRASWR